MSQAQASGILRDQRTGAAHPLRVGIARVDIEALRLDGGFPLPIHARPGDAGLDLRASERARLEPGERRLVPTGLAVAIPPGYAGLVLPRSGLAMQKGVTVLNAPGLIDSGYRGELKVLLINHGAEPVDLARGERIAQLVVQPVAEVKLVEADRLPESERGAGGFGSTGA
jgi:dUTP pyrophosphatase